MVKRTERTKVLYTRQPNLLSWVSILVPLLSVAFARVVNYDQLLNVRGPSSTPATHSNWNAPVHQHHQPNYNNPHQAPEEPKSRSRVKRDGDGSGKPAGPKYAEPVAIFGMSFAYTEDKKRIVYGKEAIEILEGLDVTITLYGRFIDGTKIRFNENGLQCGGPNDSKDEHNVSWVCFQQPFIKISKWNSIIDNMCFLDFLAHAGHCRRPSSVYAGCVYLQCGESPVNNASAVRLFQSLLLFVQPDGGAVDATRE